MKKLTAIILIFLLCALFSGCDMDETQSVRALFDPGKVYRLELTLDSKSYEAELELAEGSQTLRFLPGNVKKVFDKSGETDVCDDIVFLLPSPTAFSRLPAVIDYLRSRSFVCNEKNENKRFEFRAGDDRVTLLCDPELKRPLEITARDLTAKFIYQ